MFCVCWDIIYLEYPDFYMMEQLLFNLKNHILLQYELNAFQLYNIIMLSTKM